MDRLLKPSDPTLAPDAPAARDSGHAANRPERNWQPAGSETKREWRPKRQVAEFKGRHFDRGIVILCVRWYLRFKLSLRDLVEMMAERGLSMAHTTIMRWVQRYAPEFEKRWRRFARAVGQSWRVDETYVKVRGEWRYLYRAVDRAGRTVDFRLSPRRDVAAAKAFFRKAIKSQQRFPRTITLDGYAASHRAVGELKADGSLPANTRLRSSKYLNNLIEQDHRGVKQRIAVMLGFKEFRNAAITIAGIELLHRIRKGQFGLGGLGVQGRPAPAVWTSAGVISGRGVASLARQTPVQLRPWSP
jgi:transposase-like protein